MPSTYSTDFRITLQASGENSGTWGDVVNTNYSLLEQAVAGVLSKSVAGSSNVTLTATNGVSDESRNRVYGFTGLLTGNITVIRPAANQLKTVYNNTTGAFTLTDIGASGTGVVVPQGYWRNTYFDGTNVVDGDPFGYDGPYATLASATTTDLSTIPSANVNITGTTTITAFGTLPAGVRKFLRFSGACPITYNASSLIIRQGAASVTTDAGTTAVAISLGAGNWELDDIQYGGTAPFDRRSPGAIGGTSASTGAFTTLTISSTGTFSPANANVVLSPTGSGLVTVNPATVGAMDNMVIGANTAKAATFTTLTVLAAIGTIQTLTDAATVAMDASLGNNAKVTLGGNRTLGAPTNISGGQGGSIFITQDGTGTRTLSYNGVWKFVGGSAPVLSTAAGSVDRLDYIALDSTHIHAALAKAVA